MSCSACNTGGKCEYCATCCYCGEARPGVYRSGAVAVRPRVMEARPVIIPFESQELAAGAVAKITARSQLRFRPTWVIIPATVGKHLHVLDMIAGNTVLMAGTGDVHALCFRETLTEKLRIAMDWRTLDVSSIVRLTLKNVSKESVLVTAHLLGFTAE